VGSKDGFSPEKFHSKSDQAGSTICLFKINNGDIIGGFANN